MNNLLGFLSLLLVEWPLSGSGKTNHYFKSLGKTPCIVSRLMPCLKFFKKANFLVEMFTPPHEQTSVLSLNAKEKPLLRRAKMETLES